MKVKLNHIASIQTGVFARPSAGGDIVYLQARDFDDQGIISDKVVPEVKSDEISEKHILLYGDILFAAKGARNFATCFIKDDLKAVASTSFFILRLKRKKILPEYMSWFLNHPDVMAFLKRNAIGSSTASISKSVLADLDVLVPNLDTQEAILKIHGLRKQEKALLTKIESLRDILIDNKILKAIK